MSVVVRSKIKELVGGLRIAGDVPEALDREVENLLKRAAKRAKDNNRGTVMAKDL